MSSVRFHEAAEEELFDEIGYLELRARGLGRRFLEDVQQASDLIARHPNASPEVRSGIRKKVLRKFQYALYYTVEPEGPFILAVAHHRRRPGYWLARAQRR